MDVLYAPWNPNERSGVIVTPLQEVFLPFEDMRNLRYEGKKPVQGHTIKSSSFTSLFYSLTLYCVLSVYSRTLYICEEDRIPDPYGAYILGPYFWWKTIEFEFQRA